MSFICNRNRCRGNAYFLTCIYKFGSIYLVIFNHTVRRFCFSYFIFSKIQKFSYCNPFCIGSDCIYYLTLTVTDSTVRSGYFFGRYYTEYRTFKTGFLIHRLIHTVFFCNRPENLTCFIYCNSSLLSHIMFFNSYYDFTSVNLKRYRGCIKHISVGCTFLNYFIITVWQFFGEHKLS